MIVSTGGEHHFLSLALVWPGGGSPRLGIRWACCGTLGMGPPPCSAFQGNEGVFLWPPNRSLSYLTSTFSGTLS